MLPGQFGKKVLVTGGTGYIASWVVRKCLERGYTVRATVRDKNKAYELEQFVKWAKEFPAQLDLFEADLLKPGSFQQAMKGCEIVFHMASPFKTTKVRDPEKFFIEPALQGTRNVLGSVDETPSVKRVVLTSSVMAMCSDAKEAWKFSGGVVTEQSWNEMSSLSYIPYAYSKTLAEKEAWKIAKAQNRWDLVVINPGLVIGPSLSKRTDSASIELLRNMLSGKYKMGVPDMSMGMVDVRDVAEMHVRATERKEASGRYIAVERELKFIEMASLLSKNLKEKYELPQRTIPKYALYLVGPFLADLSWKYVSRNVGVFLKHDNSVSKQELGIEYTPIEKTLVDHANQLVKDGLL